jgi:hypothetical protein
VTAQRAFSPDSGRERPIFIVANPVGVWANLNELYISRGMSSLDRFVYWLWTRQDFGKTPETSNHSFSRAPSLGSGGADCFWGVLNSPAQ